MPLAHVEWFMKQSAHDSDKLHARQCCTYYSITNVNKTNYPFLSSYEREQTWTLTQTMSDNSKRYQSAIENIHLTLPISSSKTKSINLTNDRFISFSPSVLPSRDDTSALTCLSNGTGLKSITNQELEISPNKTIKTMNSNTKTNSNSKKSRLSTRPMRVIHENGELVVRI